MSITETVYQLNGPIHHGSCRRLGDQNKHTCQEVTGITELFEARCCRQNENDIPIKDDTVADAAVGSFAFSALTLLDGQLEGHPACKN